MNIGASRVSSRGWSAGDDGRRHPEGEPLSFLPRQVAGDGLGDGLDQSHCDNPVWRIDSAALREHSENIQVAATEEQGMTDAGRQQSRAEGQSHADIIVSAYLEESRGDPWLALHRLVVDALADLLEMERRSRRAERLVSRGYLRCAVGSEKQGANGGSRSTRQPNPEGSENVWTCRPSQEPD